ncbi:hypothetical protein DA2_2197 [Desulfovibrio sp. A2]|nr:hypothetical protein DA2_2197 [Desulfovibrio sp. A2]
MRTGRFKPGGDTYARPVRLASGVAHDVAAVHRGGGSGEAGCGPVAGQFRASFERTRHRMRCACGRKGKAARAGVRGELRP